MGKLRPLKLLNTAYWTCQNNINKSIHLFTSHWHSVHTSGSQTCSNRYPNQGSDFVLLSSIKIFRISGRKFLLQWSLIIPNNIVILVPRYPSKNRILPLGVIYPQFGNHWCTQTIHLSHDPTGCQIFARHAARESKSPLLLVQVITVKWKCRS